MKTAARRKAGVKPRGGKPKCVNGHPRTPENIRTGRGDCAICHREQQLARQRAAGVPERQPAGWACSHDLAKTMRYVKGKPKGCGACHRERERQRPHDPDKARAYAAAHRDEINARTRAWRAVNRPDVAEFRNGDALAIEYAALIDGDPCSYCGGPAGEKDHIIPVSAGGTGDWFNLAAACRHCNAVKHSKHVLQFMLAQVARVEPRLQEAA